MTDPTPWQADRPPLLAAIKRGLGGRCPVCGRSALFQGYLRVRAVCPSCAAPLGRVRADDVPPYFTILVVGHIVVPGMMVLDRIASPPVWLDAVLWVPATLVLTLALLRPIKGAIVGLMLAYGMLAAPTDAGT